MSEPYAKLNGGGAIGCIRTVRRRTKDSNISN
jgi:hypothetical protein